MKLLKTIAFDASDERVFDVAAGSGEWAVSGGFAFADAAPDSLTGKARQAFANGFLGVGSFGRSTFATVVEAGASDRNAIVQALAEHFVSVYGAPDEAAGRGAAEAELSFIAELCGEAPVHTLLALRRTWDDQGQIREEFRIVRPPSGDRLHSKAWTIVDDEA